MLRSLLFVECASLCVVVLFDVVFAMLLNCVFLLCNVAHVVFIAVFVCCCVMCVYVLLGFNVCVF